MASKFSQTLGRKIDTYFRLRARRLVLESDVKKCKSKESAMTDDIVELLGEAKIDAASGSLGSISIKRPTVGRVADWPTLYDWISETDNFQMLGRQLHQANLREFLEHEPEFKVKGLPGVELVTVVKVSATAKR